MLATILITVFLTFFVMVAALNLSSGEKNIKFKISHLYPIDSPDFTHTVGYLLGPSLVEGNKVEHLRNGVKIFPAMLDAIKSAQHSICFETYIYWSGEIGQEFSKALAQKAREGVTVNVILDAFGAGSLGDDIMQEMADAGVNMQLFHPVRWYTITKLNNRTHRKLLIVDGKIGFTGGVGIADVWEGDGHTTGNWVDSHFQIEGPAVAQMQATFHDNWLKTRATVLHGHQYYPRLTKRGECLAQVFKSSADEGSDSVRLMYLLSISAATKYIYIANSYFVPDRLTIDMLIDAKGRGVNIEIIVPGKHSDVKMVRHASKGIYGKLLKAGIKIYEFLPSMYHCKIMVVDDLWVSVGSTNFDSRSFRLNDEANLNVYDKPFAEAMKKQLEEDKKHTRLITLQNWKRRPLKQKIIENILLLFRAQL